MATVSESDTPDHGIYFYHGYSIGIYAVSHAPKHYMAAHGYSLRISAKNNSHGCIIGFTWVQSPNLCQKDHVIYFFHGYSKGIYAVSHGPIQTPPPLYSTSFTWLQSMKAVQP